MSNPANLVLISVSLSRFVLILIAVWLAARFEPRVAWILAGQGARMPGALPRALIWLALGAAFAIPLFDLVGLIRQFVELVAPPSWGLVEGSVTTFWGSAPPGVFYALSGSTTLAVYAVAFILLWRSFRDQPSSSLTRLAPSDPDRILLALALAGLVNMLVTSVAVSVAFVQVPTRVSPLSLGAAGFVGAWLIGLLLVFALALWMKMHVQADDDEGR